MLFVISGCSGGGKTTLVDALAERGFAISEEPGRTIVREELSTGGQALPWLDSVLFVQKCVTLSIQRFDTASQSPAVTFFDRSLIDAISALASLAPENAEQHLRILTDYRYARTVFMTPPWPENFENDAERRHSFEQASAEYDRLKTDYANAGYTLVYLPKSSVKERVEFVLQHIGLAN